jgi:hypothetical protein
MANQPAPLAEHFCQLIASCGPSDIQASGPDRPELEASKLWQIIYSINDRPPETSTLWRIIYSINDRPRAD